MNLPSPTLRLEIDKQALTSNWRALDAMSGVANAGAAVKADCYGLGTGKCIPVLRDAGCESFFAAHWSEVPAIAEHVDPSQIAVLHGVMDSAQADYARAAGVRPVINSPAQAAIWNNARGGACHLMVDTGINRLGVRADELSDPAIEALQIETLMSHLACADEDSAVNAQQRDEFAACKQAVRHKQMSLANSAGIALGAEFAFDLTRPGIALYGGVPRSEMAGAIKQVAHIEAAIIQTRNIEAGQTVGYNARFCAPRDMRTATVSIGYADGFLRSRGSQGYMLHGKAMLPILGKVSMDMIVVDLANVPHLKEGDWLTVPFDLENAAQQSGLSQYELLTTIGSRFAHS